MIDQYSAQLRSRGYRMTPQRLAILRILHDASQHLTPLEVCQRVRQIMPGLTEATVYRTLNFLTKQGLVLATHIGNGQLMYELAEHAHHHLVCRVCGHAHEIGHEVLETLYEQFQAKTGYQIDTVHLTFFGLCPGCQEEKPVPGPA